MNIPYFPHPVVQAMSLLDEASNDLQIALALALLNARQNDAGIERYWVAVADALTQKEHAN
jgi:hypothetical protein